MSRLFRSYPRGLAYKFAHRGSRTGGSSRYVKLHDFLAHAVFSNDETDWINTANRLVNPAVKYPPYCPNYTDAGWKDPAVIPDPDTRKWTEWNVQAFPITSRAYPVNLGTSANPVYPPIQFAKLNYYSRLYDWYTIAKVTVYYTPTVPVTQPGTITMWYEPNIASTPFSMIRENNATFDFERYCSRQKFTKTWPIWQANSMTFRLKFEWKRTLNDSYAFGSDGTSALGNGNPNQWYDYGTLYMKINAKPSRTYPSGTKFPETGLLYSVVTVKFKDFSFGRNIGQAMPNFTSSYELGALPDAPGDLPTDPTFNSVTSKNITTDTIHAKDFYGEGSEEEN